MTDRTADPQDPRPLIGEPLSLDLLNTRWAGTPVNDLLAEPGGYAVWLSSAGLAGRCSADEAGLAALREARAALAAAVGDLDREGAIGAAAVAGLNEVLQHGRLRRELGPAGPASHVEVDAPQRLAAWLAVDDFLALLAQGPHRIRKCAHEACILHFFDASQNGRRRWCSMAVCGNRAKAARHYEKVRG
ncbi:CGNR zinc finger domain-containing protein [Kitasatospora sp. CM 4170]|uniref:CGNR zinc finger domain-containing protein n=1 Tax=Kitasatospora aburaviensis TaxID=67265 RepID=A0ABW1F8N6_9ACTN|nr:CGNR zinc finger domain-containing protein [Kitasatospora sp. CM 4170]WNM46877.1 CGNR zinc finger domain-containing protein [Kitasatospora sp. CM 4170]